MAWANCKHHGIRLQFLHFYCIHDPVGRQKKRTKHAAPYSIFGIYTADRSVIDWNAERTYHSRHGRSFPNFLLRLSFQLIHFVAHKLSYRLAEMSPVQARNSFMKSCWNHLKALRVTRFQLSIYLFDHSETTIATHLYLLAIFETENTITIQITSPSRDP